MPRLSPFFNPNDQDFSSIAAGYTGQVPPLEKAELENLLGRYKAGGQKITMGMAKGKSDRQLYDMAADAVVGRLKERRAAEARAKAEAEARARAAREEAEARRRAEEQRQAAAARAATPASSGGAPRVSQPGAAKMLPDTAMPKPLSEAQVRQILNASGHPTWNPPAYARASEQALRDWIKRAERNASQSSTRTAAARATGGVGPRGIPSGPVPIDHRTTTSTTRRTNTGGGRLLIR